MQTNYVEKARALLHQNSTRVALRAAAMAMVTVAAVQATPTFSFNAPSSNSISTACSGGATSGSLAGAVTNGGLGITLSGNANLTHSDFAGNCNYLLKWAGTGAGAFNGSTANLSSNFTLTAPNNAFITGYTLTVLVNGVQQKQVNCAQAPTQPSIAKLRANFVNQNCSGPVTIPTQTFPVPATLSSYEVDLSINATWTDPTGSSVTVSVPSNSSIDITAQGAPASAPALSPVGLIATAIMLAGLAVWMFGRKSPQAV